MKTNGYFLTTDEGIHLFVIGGKYRIKADSYQFQSVKIIYLLTFNNQYFIILHYTVIGFIDILQVYDIIYLIEPLYA